MSISLAAEIVSTVSSDMMSTRVASLVFLCQLLSRIPCKVMQL